MKRARFHVLDVYPPPGSQYYADVSSAVASCWISNDEQPTSKPERALSAVVSLLRDEGWCLASVIVDEVVSEATYARKENGRAEFSRALEQGVVINVAKQRREYVGDAVDCYSCRDTLRRVLDRQGLLHSLSTAEQYANGVLDSSNEFIPVWASWNDARRWLVHWPEHQVVALEKTIAREIFTEAMDADSFMYVGVGTGEGMVTFHPADVLTLLG